jgi:DNA-binding response OmpR family regulator
MDDEGRHMTPEQQQILVVEDDDEIRRTIIDHLGDAGFNVRGTSNGNEAIPLMHARYFSTLILDLKMPYIDGFAVLQFSKATFPDTRVIIVTAYADLKNIMKCKSLGADAVIGKPFDLEELDTAIIPLTPA